MLPVVSKSRKQLDPGGVFPISPESYATEIRLHLWAEPRKQVFPHSVSFELHGGEEWLELHAWLPSVMLPAGLHTGS